MSDPRSPRTQLTAPCPRRPIGPGPGTHRFCSKVDRGSGLAVLAPALPPSAGKTSPRPGPIGGVLRQGTVATPRPASIAGGRAPLVGLLTGLEGLVGDCVLLGGTAELAQLRRDHRRLVEGRQDAHRCLAVGELLADALAVGVGQSQPLVV